MTVMEPGSEILKVDEAGRVRTPPEKREALLAEFDRSGMTGAQFARFAGVRYPTDELGAEATQGSRAERAKGGPKTEGGSSAMVGSESGG